MYQKKKEERNYVQNLVKFGKGFILLLLKMHIKIPVISFVGLMYRIAPGGYTEDTQQLLYCTVALVGVVTVYSHSYSNLP